MTLANAVLDLKPEPRRSRHEKYTANYVQLGALRISEGVHLLQEIQMDDLLYKPDDRLTAEIDRLHKLERQTIAAWNENLPPN
jgi:hypothetical protein